MSKHSTFFNIADDVIISLMQQGMSNTQIIASLIDEKSSRDPRFRKRLSELRERVSDSRILRHKYTVDDVRHSVENALCMTDVLKGLGLSPHGGNDRTIKRLIEEHNIDVSHFNVQQAVRRGKKLWTFEEVFVQGSKIPRPSLSRLVERFKVLPYQCAGCNNEGMWNGSKLRLTVDHIDGISDNNEVTNLRYLCPNCHSQTETFGGKNK